MALRWLGFALGIAVALVTVQSIVGGLVVPRAVTSRISHSVDAAIDSLFRLCTMRARSFNRRDSILAWQGPVYLVVRLAIWIALLYLAWALMLLPLIPGPAGRSFAESGSSMFTLGYAAPAGNSSTAIDYLAAFSGLVVVGLQVGYLPTIYAAFNRRETEVTLLQSRAGLPAWGPEILARTQWGIAGNSDSGAVLDELFGIWERWSAELAESHTTYPVLTRLRSPRSMSHWVTSLLAVMDAAALHLAVAPSSPPGISARLCLRMGFVAVREIGTALGFPVDDDPDPDQPIGLPYEQFEAAVEMLRGLGYPVERTAEQAWPHFRGWRVNYETVTLGIARAVDAPPSLWSGPRRWPSSPIPPRRPANRLAASPPETGPGT